MSGSTAIALRSSTSKQVEPPSLLDWLDTDQVGTFSPARCYHVHWNHIAHFDGSYLCYLLSSLTCFPVTNVIGAFDTKDRRQS
jgi:hypothetical protein